MKKTVASFFFFKILGNVCQVKFQFFIRAVTQVIIVFRIVFIPVFNNFFYNMFYRTSSFFLASLDNCDTVAVSSTFNFNLIIFFTGMVNFAYPSAKTEMAVAAWLICMV